MLWELQEQFYLFNGMIMKDDSSHAWNGHLKQIEDQLGPAPKELIARGKLSHILFDEKGLVQGFPGSSGYTFEKLEHVLGGREREMCISFMHAMTRWLPEERLTAQQLLQYDRLRKEACHDDVGSVAEAAVAS